MCARLVTSVSVLVVAVGVIATASKPDRTIQPAGPAILWRDPTDIETRNLFYGPGGKAHEPVGTFRFLDEDTGGTTPKFDVAGPDGAKWKAKLGVEAKPETVASRFVWAVGYFASENYFVPALQVDGLPQLRRGGSAVHSGAVQNVRLKRHLENETWIAYWSWESCPFAGTREWFGLRVLMAVMNNWDLKNVNNAVYQVSGSSPEQHYVVFDLGASFGTAGLSHSGKGKIEEYRRSKWLNGVSGGFVDFNVPAGPGPGALFVPPELTRRLGLMWLGRHIPVEHARWMGALLARLSPGQIRDAFRAGGYSPADVEEFAQIMERRIQELNNLSENGRRM